MDCDLFKLFLQPFITVIGWLVTILWALKHIKLSSDKNLQMQRTLARENHERELAKEVINIYKDIIVSLDKLLQAGTQFYSNYYLEKSKPIENIHFSASNLVDPIYKAYDKLSADMHRLDMWLKISVPFLPNTERIQEGINMYFKDFTQSLSNDSESIWIEFQAKLILYNSDQPPKPEQVKDAWTRAGMSLIDIRNKLNDAISNLNKELIERITSQWS